ncbi:hypothetical protein Q5P01_025245 [Channa striata]|uniref:Uncharacterized protein n=1 Tax=Channa striata TaxID=64152 RepID=A0AA88J573_CHASR|nr:hypothetical protein Q5P01_025245 [Channa striata]
MRKTIIHSSSTYTSPVNTSVNSSGRHRLGLCKCKTVAHRDRRIMKLFSIIAHKSGIVLVGLQIANDFG